MLCLVCGCVCYVRIVRFTVKQRNDFRKNLQNLTHRGIVFCYVSRIFAYFILFDVDLYFIFSHRFLVIIVSHCANKVAHLIRLIFVSCH
jgi:hypothetical protein